MLNFALSFLITIHQLVLSINELLVQVGIHMANCARAAVDWSCFHAGVAALVVQVRLKALEKLDFIGALLFNGSFSA